MCEYVTRRRRHYPVKLAKQVELLEDVDSFTRGRLRRQRICCRESLSGRNEKSDQTCVWVAGCQGCNDGE